MDIKVYGPGCASCHELYQLVMDFVAEKGLLANVDYVQDPEDISRSGVTATPALVVDGKLLSSGRIPRRKELERWLTPQPEVDRWWAKKKERPKDLKSL